MLVCSYFFGKFLLFMHYRLDVHMASPPPIDPSGASQTTGDILHGWAHGNVFNHADSADPVFVGPHTGKVFVYQSPQVPDPKKSETSIKCEVTLPQIKPVLKALAWRFSPVSSKSYFSIYVQQNDFILYQSSIKGSVYVYEDGDWAAKGCYGTALEDNDDIMWTFDEVDTLHLLIESELDNFGFQVLNL